MDQKQKQEWLDLFAEAFAGVILPRLKPIQKDVAKLKKDVTVVKNELSNVKETVERIDRRPDKQEERIHLLEATPPTH